MKSAFHLDQKHDTFNLDRTIEFTFKKRHIAQSIVNSEGRLISEIAEKMLNWEEYITQVFDNKG